MPIRAPGLKLRLHVPTEISVRPHQPTLEMLNPHDALRRIDGTEATGGKDVLVLKVRDIDVDGLVRRGLEAQQAVPGHVLDRQHGAVAEDLEVESAVGTAWRQFECVLWKILQRTKLTLERDPWPQ